MATDDQAASSTLPASSSDTAEKIETHHQDQDQDSWDLGRDPSSLLMETKNKEKEVELEVIETPEEKNNEEGGGGGDTMVLAHEDLEDEDEEVDDIEESAPEGTGDVGLLGGKVVPAIEEFQEGDAVFIVSKKDTGTYLRAQGDSNAEYNNIWVTFRIFGLLR